MAHQPYTTSVYPYPAEMWDSAAEHLETERAWMEVLLVCPNPAEACNTAMRAMSARGISDTKCLIYPEPLSRCWVIRISRLQYLDQRWDEVERRLLDNTKGKALVSIDTNRVSANDMIEEARAAMAERGLAVSVGYANDPSSLEGLLRVELA